MSGLVIIGAGPGLGAAIARRFAAANLPVSLVARKGAAELAAQIGRDARGYTADATDEKGLTAVLDRIVAERGVPEALVYNAAIIQRDQPGDLSIEEHLKAWSVNVLGALSAARHPAPAMAEHGGGTIVISGGMPQPDARYTSLSLGKAGVRALTAILHEAYGPQNIHVATVTIDCHMVAGTDSDPALVAEHYWDLHQQPREAWDLEIVHRGSTPV